MSTTQDRFLRHMPRDGSQFKRKFDLWGMLHIDPPLLVALLLAASLGLFELYSASGRHLDLTLKQMMSFGIGLTVMFVLAQIPPRTYQTLSPWFYAGGVTLLVAVALVGDVRMGAQRWLSIPGFGSVQPSEFMKLGMPMMVAWFLSHRPQPLRSTDIVASLLLILLPAALIAEQVAPDNPDHRHLPLLPQAFIQFRVGITGIHCSGKCIQMRVSLRLKQGTGFNQFQQIGRALGTGFGDEFACDKRTSQLLEKCIDADNGRQQIPRVRQRLTEDGSFKLFPVTLGGGM